VRQQGRNEAAFFLADDAMAEYYALQAAFCFSIAHIFVRLGLAHSNALTGSLISLGTCAAGFWILALFLAPLAALQSPSIGYFAAAGFFAPAIGQTLGYIGMERIGVARAASIVNTSPMFSSVFAVLFLGELWLAQNIAGTCLVIGGIAILSSSRAASSDKWHRKDIIYPLLGALAFGVSTLLRKRGLLEIPNPILAAAVTVGSAFVFFLVIVAFRGGRRAFQFKPRGNAWLFGAALVNMCAILSFFSALNLGKIVRVEPLVACNPLLTLLWSSLFFRGIEQLTSRDVVGALVIVSGTVLVVAAK
jgi:DME family drug/metabolite transporter